MWKPNEEFCHIIVDTGIFDHHLPDSVQGAVERLYQHQIFGKQKLPDAEPKASTPRNASLRRAKTVAGTLDTNPDDKQIGVKKNKTYFYRSNTESDITRTSPEYVCTIESPPGPSVCHVNGRNSAAMGDVSVNENTIQVTVDLLPDHNNKFAVNNEYISTYV